MYRPRFEPVARRDHILAITEMSGRRAQISRASAWSDGRANSAGRRRRLLRRLRTRACTRRGTPDLIIRDGLSELVHGAMHNAVGVRPMATKGNARTVQLLSLLSWDRRPNRSDNSALPISALEAQMHAHRTRRHDLQVSAAVWVCKGLSSGSMLSFF